MKYLILLTLLLCGFETAQAQVVFGNKETLKKDSSGFKLTGSMQFGFGGVNPKDVNHYIEKYLLENGFTRAITLANTFSLFKQYSLSDFEMKSQTSIGFSLTAQPISKMRLRLMYEFGYNPKSNRSLSVGNIDSDFHLRRNSIGVLSQYYIQIKDFNHIFVGVGILKHYMKFEQFHANATGYRFELGYSAMAYYLDCDFFLSVDYANGSVSNQYGPYSPASIDFSGIAFGIRITPWFR